MNTARQFPPLSVTVGVDLGGTGTRIVALDRTGAVQGERTIMTPHHSGSSDSAVEELSSQIRAAAGDMAIVGVGIGASGPVDARGVIRNDDTLPAFSHIPLTDMLTDRLGVACVIDNDAVTAAVGEHVHGAGRGATSLLMVTLGTGIGAALLVDGQPVRAADGSHPEAGHIPVPGIPAPCYCGLSTCWEQLASRTALDELTSGQTAEYASRAAEGDVVAETVFDAYGARVAAGLEILLPLCRPDRLVLGGGAAQYLPLFAPALDEGLRRNPGYEWNPPRCAAALGAMSGAIGAAVLAAKIDRIPSTQPVAQPIQPIA